MTEGGGDSKQSTEEQCFREEKKTERPTNKKVHVCAHTLVKENKTRKKGRARSERK